MPKKVEAYWFVRCSVSGHCHVQVSPVHADASLEYQLAVDAKGRVFKALQQRWQRLNPAEQEALSKQRGVIFS